MTDKEKDKLLVQIAFEELVKKKDFSMAEYALSKGADINGDDSDNWTPLLYAAYFGHLEAVKFLVEHGAAKNRCNKYDDTPFLVSLKENKVEVARYLIDQGVRVDKSLKGIGRPLGFCVGRGHLALVKLLVEKGANIDAKDRWGRTALQKAEDCSSPSVVAYLEYVIEVRKLKSLKEGKK